MDRDAQEFADAFHSGEWLWDNDANEDLGNMLGEYIWGIYSGRYD